MCFSAPALTAPLSDWTKYRSDLNALESNERVEMEKKYADRVILIVQLYPHGLNVEDPGFKEAVDFIVQETM